MNKREMAANYRKAAKLVDNGWVQCQFAADLDGEPRFCATGAVSYAASGKCGCGTKFRDTAVEWRVMKKLFKWERGLISFNDTIGRTAKEVSRVLRAVARALEHGGKV